MKWNKAPLSLSARLMILISAALSLALLFFSWIMIQSVMSHFEQQDKYSLQQLNTTIKNLLTDPLDPEEIRLNRIRNVIYEHKNIDVYLDDSQGNILISPPSSASSWPLMQRVILSKEIQDNFNEKIENQRITVLSIKTNIDNQENQYRLVTALSLDFHHNYLDQLTYDLLYSAAILCLLVLFVVYFLVYHGLRPLRLVSNKIQAVTSADLSIRLDANLVPKELTKLVNSFNEMIEKIEDVFTRQINFSADIAHEMRTPITNLVTETQIVLGKKRTNEELKDVLYSGLEEYERLSKMITDMLFLAQADDNRLIPEKKQINIREEIEAVFEYFEYLVEEKEIALKISGEVGIISGDKSMIRRVITNLISNAIRYTPTGKSITLFLDDVENNIRIIIDNPGEPIAAEHLPRLFDRFYRIDKSRQRKNEGSGIGLAIVKSIIHAHGGRISVTSDNESTRFIIYLPYSK